MKYIILFIFALNTLGEDTLRVALFNVEPFSYMDNSQKLTGVSYLFFTKLEAETNLKFEYVLLPYTRVISSLKDGSVDMAMIYPNVVFESDFIKLAETIGNDNLIIANKPIKSLSDLSGLSIARIDGAKYSQDFDSNLSIVKVNAKNYLNEINLFISGRVSGFVIPRVALNHIVKSKQFDEGLFKNQLLLNHQKNWIHVRKNLDAEKREKIISASRDVLKKNKLKKLDELYDKLP